MKLRVFCDVAPCSHALMMEAIRTSETSVNFNVATRRYTPEDFIILLSSSYKKVKMEINKTIFSPVFVSYSK
jgi:hypothetical protein